MYEFLTKDRGVTGRKFRLYAKMLTRPTRHSRVLNVVTVPRQLSKFLSALARANCHIGKFEVTTE